MQAVYILTSLLYWCIHAGCTYLPLYSTGVYMQAVYILTSLLYWCIHAGCIYTYLSTVLVYTCRLYIYLPLYCTGELGKVNDLIVDRRISSRYHVVSKEQTPTQNKQHSYKYSYKL